jgi:calcineurin-like phosphoesterase family protein
MGRMMFVSDPHIGHANIIKFERTQFATIDEHDSFLRGKFHEWARKYTKDDDTFFVLGDWGDTSALWWLDEFRCKLVFVRGNHDRQESRPLFEDHFDEVHWYPYYLSDRLVVSHFPVAVYKTQVNVHGHLHRSKLVDRNHICASLDVIGYEPVTDKTVSNAMSGLEKHCTRFLDEPWAADYVFTSDTGMDSIVVDRHNRIDLSATRMLMQVKKGKVSLDA